MDALRAILLGIIEGLTEFLPVSSTGHLLLAQYALGIDPAAAPWNTLLWVSQLGAIAAVVVYFWGDLWRRVLHPVVGGIDRHILTKLAVSMLPTVVLALLLKKPLEHYLDNPLGIAAALILGAGAMEWIDRRYRRESPMRLEDLSLKQAFWIGVIQCLSMWPGISRSGATIMGGMALGLTPRVAAEYSFYLAIPTMLAASVKTLWSEWHNLSTDGLAIVVAGSAMSFVVALLVIEPFLEFVKRFRFTVFAGYRVVLGLIVLAVYFATR